MILPMLPLYPTPNQLAQANGLINPNATLQNVLSQSLLRRKPAAQTPTVPQAECPVSLRPVVNSKFRDHAELSIRARVISPILASRRPGPIMKHRRYLSNVRRSVLGQWHHASLSVSGFKVSWVTALVFDKKNWSNRKSIKTGTLTLLAWWKWR